MDQGLTVVDHGHQGDLVTVAPDGRGESEAVTMAVCKKGREPIEHIDGAWGPSERNVHDGACTPALMTTIELITEGVPPCYWCAWPTAGASMFLIDGKPCCEVHVLRAMQDVTTVLEARGAIRGVSIDRS